MKTSNNYIGLDTAMVLIQKGWIFAQNLAQTEFKLKKDGSWYKLNKKTATELKKQLQQLRSQIKITL